MTWATFFFDLIEEHRGNKNTHYSNNYMYKIRGDKTQQTKKKGRKIQREDHHLQTEPSEDRSRS